ncbi:hypothetical protein [Plantactinospora mayteni]|uniref:Uncharacterized protein n=1 Tax=Plantactinospora mayteni TaxID=566021 RepID=A0ABQ4EIM4_9ACTN|nr:hypothetical protein [Plantactinospora mayteni]GIG94578.1 hypothetical protein Pma05_11510 [Plantactinospora mayteni]
MPTYEHSPMFALLVEAPVELTPLYAVLAGLHQAMSGKPVGTCVISCHQISGALHHLGFEAEPIAACATLYRTTGTFTEVSEVGVWKRPPILRLDGTTTGHMVVWTPSFAQLIDPTLVQDPTLYALAARDPVYSIPVSVEVSTDRVEVLRTRPVVALDERLHASWLLLPEWTEVMNTVLDGPEGTAATLGGLVLAADALVALRHLGHERDLTQLSELYPQLGALLAGRRQLPPLPAQVPPELLHD